MTNARTPRHKSAGGLHNRVVLARIGGFTIVNFGLFAAIGGAVGAYLVLARQIQAGMEPREYALLAFGLIPLLVVVGSRAFVIALEWREFVASPLQTLRKPGFAFQGGFVAGAVGFVVLIWRHDLDPWLLADSFAFAIPLGHAFGRIGCHTYGCCHGKPTRSRLAIRFSHPDSKVVRASGLGGVPLHPTQLYSAAANLTMFVVLGVLATRETHPGQLAGVYLLMESIGRFVMEFFRGIPTARVLGLSPFQWVSVSLFAVGLLVMVMASTVETAAPWNSDGLGRSLGEAATLWFYPLWVFGLFFAAFGVHGRQVGRV